MEEKFHSLHVSDAIFPRQCKQVKLMTFLLFKEKWAAKKISFPQKNIQVYHKGGGKVLIEKSS